MKKKTRAKECTLAKTPYLVKCLDISTGHISEDDSRFLKQAEKNPFQPLIVYHYEEGCFVYIPKDNFEELATFGYSDQFVRILIRGKKLGCKYVQFDRDGTTYADLTTFSW
jgi:hypothetical protein